MKILIFVFVSILSSISFAEDLSDWSNEDLCRWVDSVSIPEPISLEINMREVVCYDVLGLSQSALSVPISNEHGTVFPSPALQDKKKATGLNFMFNYKITL
jgi:hypothetical protein